MAKQKSEPKTGAKKTGPKAAAAKKKAEPLADIPATVQLLKDYVRQETLGPLKGAGRWIALGIVGALLIGGGTAFLALGALRLIQSEWPGTFAGRWMILVPYATALMFCFFVAGMALLRINKQPLHKEKS